jgi:uncharacterized damage-inducible protein DinB
MTERVEPPYVAGELELLEGFLDYYRETLAVKCEGLTDEQLKERSVPPSALSLLGLVRHMAEVERAWFRIRLNGEDLGFRYVTLDDANPDGDFNDVDDADAAEGMAAWREEIDHARRIVRADPNLDRTFTHPRRGEISLRWVLIHMIEEYARHAGHADLLRERIDGAVGD